MENTQNHTSFKDAPEHEEQEQIESETPEVRWSIRERRPLAWHSEYFTESNIAYCLLTEDGEPSTFHEAIKSTDVSMWMTAMQEEIEALHKNNTWDLVPLPQGRKAIGNKWVYKIKRDDNDQVERYRARLVVKGYAQKEGIDFNEIFSPVVRLTTIRVVLAMRAIFDLHLEQLDVKLHFFMENLKKKFICSNQRVLLKQARRTWFAG
jgi:ATP-binding cassette subfamily B (MDR/TAP) protein 1